MNTRLTKIKDTEILSAVPKTGHVMAEVDGVVKRVPGNKVGGVPDGGEAGQVLTKTEEGAAWTTPESGLPEGGEPFKQLVTDASGKTVWEDRLAFKTGATYAYDGVLEGKDTFDWNGTFVKISDDLLNEEQLAMTYGYSEGQVQFQGMSLAELPHFSNETVWHDMMFGGICICYSTHIIVSNGNEYDVPSTGIYINANGFGWVTWKWGSVKTIDPEYIGGWKALGEGEPVKTAIVDNVTVTVSEQYGMFGGVADSTQLLTEGMQYEVVWNGTKYDCVAYTFNGQMTVIGDVSIVGASGNGNGEPFVIHNAYQDSGTQLAIFCAAAGEYTLSIYTSVAPIIPVPKKYLPETAYVNGKTFDMYTDEDCEKLYEAFANGKVVLIRPDGSGSAWTQVLSCFYSETVGLWVVYFKNTALYYVEGTPANGFTRKHKEFTSEMT